MARVMWAVIEPYHAVVYFSPVARQAIEAAGLRGFWRGYFATRAAPMGRVPVEVVTAVFYNFHPGMVARAIPDVWDIIEPMAAWQARVDAADAALTSAIGDRADDPDLATAAEILRRATEACEPPGRALFAAHIHLEWPDQPHLVAWHAATLLREFRGDGHNAALLAAGIDGCAAHVLADATGAALRADTQPNRGWSDEDWQAASERLAARGVLDGRGALTPEGTALIDEIEVATNRASLAPWLHVGGDACASLRTTLTGHARQIFAAGWFPARNPIGVPAP